ncbi:PASTA domain-containing protein [Nitrospinota bacterium]
MIRALFRGIFFTAFLLAIGGVSALGGIYFFRGGEGVFLPQVVGQDIVRGLEMLSERGIPLEVSGWTFSDEVPQNHIVSQLPAGGRRIRKGRTVSLVISRGARDVRVPPVVGEDLSRAETLVRLNGLRVGPIERVFDSRRRMDGVIGSWPPLGESIRRGDQVVLLVSQGPKERAYAMPSLIGDPVNAALDRVREVGLTVGRVRYVDRKGALRGTIVGQIPQTGQRVLAGHRVHVDVARGSQSLEGNFSVLRYRVPPGRPVRHLRIELESKGEKKEALSREVRAGEEIHLLVPLNGRTWVRIYLDEELIEEQDH